MDRDLDPRTTPDGATQDDATPASPARRSFLKGTSLAAFGAALGMAIPYGRNLPAGVIPVALAEVPATMDGKDGLTVLGDRPVNAETPPHLLDDEITPTARMFVRDNGVPPASVDAAAWSLSIDGEVDTPLTLSIADLGSRFEAVERALVVECGGNGRAFFDPPVSGNQWTLGAVGCPNWRGVRLADVLKAAGVKESAVYTAHFGADTHLSGDPAKLPISRGVPIEKAMDPENLIAWEMNGGPMHIHNGHPLRLVIPGYPGSVSHKWLTRIQIRDVVHDGPKMGGSSYRVPRHPVAPGTDVPDEDMVIIEEMPVKSLITFPQTGVSVPASDARTAVRGHAWAGNGEPVASVMLSSDFGATWVEAELTAPVNRYAWQRFTAEIAFPEPGYYEIWAKAADSRGVAQPFGIAWNPKGYLNNALHRIAVSVA